MAGAKGKKVLEMSSSWSSSQKGDLGLLGEERGRVCCFHAGLQGSCGGHWPIGRLVVVCVWAQWGTGTENYIDIAWLIQLTYLGN